MMDAVVGRAIKTGRRELPADSVVTYVGICPDTCDRSSDPDDDVALFLANRNRKQNSRVPVDIRLALDRPVLVGHGVDFFVSPRLLSGHTLYSQLQHRVFVFTSAGWRGLVVHVYWLPGYLAEYAPRLDHSNPVI